MTRDLPATSSAAPASLAAELACSSKLPQPWYHRYITDSQNIECQGKEPGTCVNKIQVKPQLCLACCSLRTLACCPGPSSTAVAHVCWTVVQAEGMAKAFAN